MRKGPDIVRRFTPTPLKAELRAMGHRVQLETNSPAILAQTLSALSRESETRPGLDPFVWRLVSDADSGLSPPWPDFSRFSADGLHVTNVGQRSFLAVDAQARAAVGFVAESLVNDEPGFEQFILAPLFSATGAAMGLPALSAACIADDEKGLLILGPKGSGKTTYCYAASKAGFQFHAGQVVFLETRPGAVSAWGDFWPVAFHPGADRVFPELTTTTRPIECTGSRILCLDRAMLGKPPGNNIVVHGTVCLEELVADGPRLRPLTQPEFEATVLESTLFSGFPLARAELVRILPLLGRLPAYRLVCGHDPRPAVESFRTILGATA